MKSEIERIIKQSVTKGHFWNEPLISYSKANDPRFLLLKESVGPFHSMPGELLPDAESVIAFFIPFIKEFAESNNQPGLASGLWSKMYVETNRLIRDISVKVRDYLDSKGIKSVIFPATHNFDKEKLISGWSHRHVAEICGLGRFGLNNMLITEAGCCGRFGTIITNLEISIEDIKLPEQCLYKKSGKCGICVDKCESGALQRGSFDRFKCHLVCLGNGKHYKGEGKAEVCGKCLVSLPCSYKNPIK